MNGLADMIGNLMFMIELPVLLAVLLTLWWPELNRAGAAVGWVFYRGAMRRLEHDRQHGALRALIYVQSGDAGGLLTYSGPPGTGQVLASGSYGPGQPGRHPYATRPGPCLRHGWCGDSWCPQCPERIVPLREAIDALDSSGQLRDS